MIPALPASTIDDLDAARLAAWIAPVPAAPGLPRNEAIRIAGAFAEAGRVTTWPATGPAVWLGIRVALRATSGTRGYAFARVEVRGGALRGFVAPLRPGSFDEETDVAAAVAALQAGRPVGASRAASYVRTAAPAHGDHPIVAARGPSAVIDGGDGARAFLRQLGDRLLVIEPRSTATASGARYEPAAAYAELWRLR